MTKSHGWVAFSWIIAALMALGIASKALTGEPPTWWTVGQGALLMLYARELSEHYVARLELHWMAKEAQPHD